MKDKPTIGWKEIIDLPELGLFNIPVKIDTGARTSVLHADQIRIFEKDNQMYINCLLTVNSNTAENKEVTLPVYKEKIIKSSFGEEEKRYVVLTKIKLFDQIFDIKLSFRDRSAMAFPMLLGRNFIHKKFLVDVYKFNISRV